MKSPNAIFGYIIGSLKVQRCNKADKMMKDAGDYGCNSWENESIKDGKRQFDEIEVVVKRYREVMRRRILAELAKTPLNADVNEMIVSMF